MSASIGSVRAASVVVGMLLAWFQRQEERALAANDSTVIRCGGYGLRIVSIEHESQQWLGFGDAHAPPDPRTLTVLNRAWDGRAWQDAEHDFATSFDILHVASSHRDSFYVLGRADNGDIVVEHWRSKSARGRTSRGASPAAAPAYRRTELHRGAELSRPRALGADPADRFLLIVHGEPARLSRMQLGAGNPVTQLDSGAQIPDLERVDSVFPRQHATAGRVWTLERFGKGSSYRTLLLDSDDDQVFEQWIPLIDHRSYEAQYPASGFTDDFVSWQER